MMPCNKIIRTTVGAMYRAFSRFIGQKARSNAQTTLLNYSIWLFAIFFFFKNHIFISILDREAYIKRS